MKDVKVTVRISREDYDKMVQWFEMSSGITVPDFYKKCPFVQVLEYDAETKDNVSPFFDSQ